MFTGIIRLLGRVHAIQAPAHSSPVVRLAIAPNKPLAEGFAIKPGAGDSIAVDGCCLTVVADPDSSGLLLFDVVPETLRVTTLGSLKAGQAVHLEQAATASTLLDGHLVQGHVDGVAKVVAIQTSPEWRVRLAPPAALMPFIVPKGSVTLAGVSLTIAAIHHGGPVALGWFEVALIPTTLAKTNLGSLRVGDGVNIECDAMAKTIVNFLKHYGERATERQTDEAR